MNTYYYGIINKVTDEKLFSVTVNIDGVGEDIPALAFRNELDEPKPGDPVIVINLDPVFGSVMLYKKLKGTEFIGFRNKGKKLSITDDSIVLGIFNEDYEDSEDPKTKNYIKLDKDGNIFIHTDKTITVDYGCTIEAKGCNIELKENSTLKTSEYSQCGNSFTGGFNCLGHCAYTGVTHTSNTIKTGW